MNFQALSILMNDPTKLSIKPGADNPEKDTRHFGAYITVTLGLSSKTFFIGVDTSTGKDVIEQVE